MRVTAKSHSDVIAISQGAVIEDVGGRSVFVVQNGIARKQVVTLGSTEGDQVIIREGLSAGETLVTVGQRELIDGQPVNIVQ